MTPGLFRKLAALGLSTDQMAGVLEIFEADAEVRKAKVRNRVEKWRAKNKAETLSNVTQRNETLHEGSRASVARGLDNLQTQKITGQEEKKEKRAAEPRGVDAFRHELSSILDGERIDALVAVRRQKGATLTANTGRLLAAAIQKCPLSAAEVADEMALRNWTSVKPEWLDSRVSPRSGAPPGHRQNAVEALASLRARERQHEPSGPIIDHGDAERVWPAEPRLRGLLADAGQAMRWPVGSGDH